MTHVWLRIVLSIISALLAFASLFTATVGAADPEGRTNSVAKFFLGLTLILLLLNIPIWMIR